MHVICYYISCFQANSLTVTGNVNRIKRYYGSFLMGVLFKNKREEHGIDAVALMRSYIVLDSGENMTSLHEGLSL